MLQTAAVYAVVGEVVAGCRQYGGIGLCKLSLWGLGGGAWGVAPHAQKLLGPYAGKC